MIDRDEINFSNENIVATIRDIRRTLTIPLNDDDCNEFEITIEYSETDDSNDREFLGYKIDKEMNRFHREKGSDCNIEDDVRESIRVWFYENIPLIENDIINEVIDIVWEKLSDLELV